MSRIALAFKAFFAILFKDTLPESVAQAFGYVKESEAARPSPAPASKPVVTEVRTADGALQLLGVLQRDARWIDFLMEDISAYGDDQVGAAVRPLHEQSRSVLARYVTIRPVIDGVEGTSTQIETRDPNCVKLLGNVPADGKAAQGILRHRGWRAEKVDLPKIPSGQDVRVLAPAEIEIE